jgi:hypothetical protein
VNPPKCGLPLPSFSKNFFASYLSVSFAQLFVRKSIHVNLLSSTRSFAFPLVRLHLHFEKINLKAHYL